MLKLNTDEVRNLQFEVSIQGINYDELKGSLKFIIEDVEYGIPVKIQKELVSVEVPPLEEIVAKGMKNGDIVECKLDIFGNGFYLNPWGGQFELATPVKMETKNYTVDNKQPPKTMVAELAETKDTLDKEAILEMLFEKLEEKGFTTKIDQAQKPINLKPITESKMTAVKGSALTRKELVEQKIKSKFKHVNNLVKNVKSLTEGKKIISKPISVPTRKYTTESSDIMDKIQQLKGYSSTPTNIISNKSKVVHHEIVDKDDPIMLMESVGMKNPKIQQVMLDKAIELGGDGNKAITETLKKLLGINQPDPYEQYMKANSIGK